MRFTFNFPDIGEGITEGKILEWYVKEGQTVKAGENLVKMETDKVVADIPSPKKGMVKTCFGKIGDIVEVDSPLVILEIEGKEKIKKTESNQAAAENQGVVGTLEEAREDDILPVSDEGQELKQTKKNTDKKTLATPVARAMAKELGVDVNNVPGTGPGGRVTKKDIRFYHERKKHISKSTAGQPEEIVEISQIRKTIAKKMLESKHNAAHMSVYEEVEVSPLISLIKSQKQKLFENRGIKLSILPFVVKAVTESLKLHKSLNSRFDMKTGHLIYKHYYNIGIAVDAPDGLMVPIIRNADRMTICQLAETIADLAQRARDRKLTLADLKDGTFSITNFGAIAGTQAVPIINYPEVAILGIGRYREMPVVKNGVIEPGFMMNLSLSVDHCAVDGGDASRFLGSVYQKLSDPVSMLLG